MPFLVQIRRTSCALAFLCACGLSWAAPDDSAELRKLLERVARADENDASEAADALIERVTGPIGAAIGATDWKTLDERVRVQMFVSRLSAALQVRAFRSGLTGEEAQRFDAFHKRHPQLVEQLWDPDPARRAAALGQIPLEPGTGAATLITAKINDNDPNVIEMALQLAGSLKDPALVSGLRQFLRDAVELSASGLARSKPDVVLMLALYSSRAIQVLGQHGASEALPEILTAVKAFAGLTDAATFFPLENVVPAIGRIGDESSAAHLLPFLEDSTVLKLHRTPSERLARQTVGDLVLLSLLRIYKLEPAAFGFAIVDEQGFSGFESDDARREALRRFKVWRQENAGKPASERQPPTSKPAAP
jgi:hypothetical protein